MSRKTISGVAIVVIAACSGLYLSRGPWIAYQQQKVKADAANKEVAKAEQDKTDLLRQQATLESPMGREKAARALGYLKTGEQPVTQEHINGSSDLGAAGR